MRKAAKCLLLFTTLFLLCNAAYSFRFEPLFKIKNITGKCKVLIPGENEYVPAIEKKAYLYGTRVMTGKKSSLIIELSPLNECLIKANTSLTMVQAGEFNTTKKLLLDEGDVEATIEEMYQETGNIFNIETAMASFTTPSGGVFTASASIEADLKDIKFTAKKGEMKIYGPHFEIPNISKDGEISVSFSHDRTYTRIHNQKGTYNINLEVDVVEVDIDSGADPRSFEMTEGAMVKIYARNAVVDDVVLVTLIFVAPDGTSSESQTVTYNLKVEPKQEDAPDGTGEELNGTGAEEKPAGDDVLDDIMDDFVKTTTGEGNNDDIAFVGRGDDDSSKWPVIAMTTTTTTSTTTTTVPPKDMAEALLALATAPAVTPVGLE